LTERHPIVVIVEAAIEVVAHSSSFFNLALEVLCTTTTDGRGDKVKCNGRDNHTKNCECRCNRGRVGEEAFGWSIVSRVRR
jgi:hypothetical protein